MTSPGYTALALSTLMLINGCNESPYTRVKPYTPTVKEKEAPAIREAWRDIQGRGAQNPEKKTRAAAFSTKVPLNAKYAALMDLEARYAEAVDLISPVSNSQLKILITGFENRDKVWEALDLAVKFTTDLEKIKGRVLIELVQVAAYNEISQAELETSLKLLLQSKTSKKELAKLDDTLSTHLYRNVEQDCEQDPKKWGSLLNNKPNEERDMTLEELGINHSMKAALRTTLGFGDSSIQRSSKQIIQLIKAMRQKS
jgi:hypothetical protein